MTPPALESTRTDEARCVEFAHPDFDVIGLATAFAALGEKKRLEILGALSGGEQCACDLTGCCGDRQPLLSFHLRKLREAGLVCARKDGRWKYYAVDRQALRDLAAALVRIADGEIQETSGELRAMDGEIRETGGTN